MAEKFGERFIAFGELLLRLAPPNYEKIRMANQFIVTYGGAEANVAVSLSNLGIDSSYFTVVPDFKPGGVKGGLRTFEYPVILRAVNTKDAMTATVEDVPFALLEHITDRITKEVPGVNRVLYDLTPKPCGTIEWE